MIPLFSWRYTFSTQTDEDLTASQIRFDAGAPYSTVTRVWIRNQNTEGDDVFLALINLPIGTELYIQDQNDHTIRAKFLVSGAGLDRGGHVEIPVGWIDSTGAAFGNNQTVLAIGIAADQTAPPVIPPAELPEPVGPFLTIGEAREILRITDPARDSEINLYLLQATGIVLDYLKSRGDPTWTSATAPQVIKAATSRALVFTWEHRGDRPAEGDAERLWTDLRLLLDRRRDPAIA